MKTVAAAVAAAMLASTALAGQAQLAIAPGPIQMSAEERAMRADPEHGVDHAIILIEETNREEDLGETATRQRYHLRAKVWSSQGRDVASLSIPFERSEITSWWGRVLLPNGAVLETPLDDAAFSVGVDRGGERLPSTTPIHLRGIVPGAVIDLGYEARSSFELEIPPIELQRAYPIKRLRYRWEPRAITGMASAFALTNGGKRLPIRVTNEAGALLVEADNLPVAAAEEPYSPPDWERNGKLLLYYYLESEKRHLEYWTLNGMRFDRSVRDWVRTKSVWRNALREIPMPEDANLEGKLRAVYTWLESTMVNTWESDPDPYGGIDSRDDRQRHDAQSLLQQREANGYDLARLFMGFALYLGADANLVLAVDRGSHTFMPEYLSFRQFGGFLVALRLPGGDPSKPIFLAPGSGLPWGELPWYYSGATALLITPEGGVPVLVPAAPPDRNRSETTVTLRFSTTDTALHADWTRRGIGQAGYDERRTLRSLSPEERDSREACLCGSPEVDVAAHESPQLHDPTAGFELHCTTLTADVAPPEEVDVFHLLWNGAWLEPTPDLTAPSRLSPVTFPFPKIEDAQIEIESPTGFAPAPRLPDSSLASKFGRYTRTATSTERGVTIKRTLVLSVMTVEPESYPELLEFLKQVEKADNQRVTFKRSVPASTPMK